MKYVNVEYDGIAYMTNKNDNNVEGLDFSHCHDRYEILYVISGGGTESATFIPLIVLTVISFMSFISNVMTISD